MQLPEFLIFSQEKMFLLLTSYIIFLIKTSCIVWYILMWSFRCSHLNLKNHWTLEVFKKTAKINLKFFMFHLKIDFYGWKNIFRIWNRIYSDRSELDLSDANIDQNSKFPFQSKVFMKKTAANYQNC